MSATQTPVNKLVVDANGFIKNAKIETIGSEIFTLREVVGEIKDSETKQRLHVLPYELHFKVPSTEAIKHVTEFSKKTGDYPSLSATDLKVLALAYQLEVESVGSTKHLKSAPDALDVVVSAQSVSVDPRNIVGFHASGKPEEEKAEEKDESCEEKAEEEKEEESENESSEEEDSSDGEGDWITPDNLQEALQQMDADVETLSSAQDPIHVACLTSDFAMQNVLLHMGLKVVSLDGMLVKKLRTFILRCYACFKTTSVMTKKFCPSCGNSTLKRVAISLDPVDGTTQIHLSRRKQLTAKGKRFSLPMPKGGKHGFDPILCDDQPVAQNRMSRKALGKVDPFDPEYVARDSPFSLNDISSRAALLGLGNHGRRVVTNPNQKGKGKKRGGKRN